MKPSLPLLVRAVVPWSLVAAAAVPCQALRITHLANEGFLIESDGSKVLVDALIGEGLPPYEVPSAQLRHRMATAQAPFHDVDLVLATHHHGDHFDPEGVASHLLHNPRAVFVSTDQAVGLLRELEGHAELASRIRAVVPDEGEFVDLVENGVRLRVLRLHHGRSRPIQNLGFVLQLKDGRVLHVGDTEVTAAELAVHGLPSLELDVAFLPFWQLLDPNDLASYQKALEARYVVPMHIPTEEAPADYFGAPGGRRGLLERLRDHDGVVVLEGEWDAWVVESRN